MRVLVLGSTVLLAAGCASTLSTLQTARPVEPKHVQVTGGTGFYAPLGPTWGVLEQGLRLAQKGVDAVNDPEKKPFAYTEEEQQELLTIGMALAVMPPSQGYEVALRTGVVKDLDVGLRYSVSAVRADAKYRFFHAGDDEAGPLPGSVPLDPAAPPRPSAQSHHARRSFDMALGLGVSRYLFKNPVFDVLEFVRLDDFSRWDLEAPLYASAEFGDFLKLYGAAKYVYSRTTLDEKLVNYSEQASNITGLDLSLPTLVHSHFVGLTAGLAVGYRWIHLMLELTSGYTFCSPLVFGRVRPLGGVTLYPAAGVSLSF